MGELTEVQAERLERVLTLCERHEDVFYGKDGSLGLVQKVNVIWYSYTWAWCTLSAVVASAGTLLIEHYAK